MTIDVLESYINIVSYIVDLLPNCLVLDGGSTLSPPDSLIILSSEPTVDILVQAFYAKLGIRSDFNIRKSLSLSMPKIVISEGRPIFLTLRHRELHALQRTGSY